MEKFEDIKRSAVKEMARQAIFEATLAALKEQGYEGLTMQNVAAKAGIATGTLYNYFKNKDDLLVYAQNKIHYLLIDYINTTKDNIGTAKEKLAHYVKKGFQFAQDYMDVFNILDQANIFHKIPKEDLLQNHLEFRNLFSNIIEEGIAEGCFRKVNPVETGELFSLSLKGMICFKAELGTFEPKADQKKVLDFFFFHLGCI